MWQLLGWVLVFAGLIIMNEVARRTKVGGGICFFAIPAGLTIYFISIYNKKLTVSIFIYCIKVYLFYFYKVYFVSTSLFY